MEPKNLEYTEVLNYARQNGLDIISEENFIEARDALFTEMVKAFAVQNNCDYEQAKINLSIKMNAIQPDRVGEYREKIHKKIERLENYLDKAKHESSIRYKTAKALGDMIPMGQPILIGHHSERRHRRHIEEINSNMRKSIEADNKASYYERKIKNTENNYSISSDDPEAIEKLELKLASLNDLQTLMKRANEVIKKKKLNEEEKTERLIAQGFTFSEVKELLSLKRFGGMGFAGFQLTNNSANMRRVKLRIEELKKLKTLDTTAKEAGGLRIVKNVDARRLQLFFPGKPDEEIRKTLKSCGFRWSPFNGCWQAILGNYRSEQAAELVFKNFKSGV